MDCKPDHQLEKHKVKVLEQVTWSQPDRQDLVSNKGEVHNVSPGSMSQPVNLVDPVSEGDGMTHSEDNEVNVDKQDNQSATHRSERMEVCKKEDESFLFV